jgi:hypothetical protein
MTTLVAYLIGAVIFVALTAFTVAAGIWIARQ